MFLCNTCSTKISCMKGKYEVERHGEGKKHPINMTKKNPVTGAKIKNMNILHSLKNAETKATEQRKTKDAALKAEAAISSLIATHNARVKNIKSNKDRKTIKKGPKKRIQVGKSYNTENKRKKLEFVFTQKSGAPGGSKSDGN